MPLQDTIHKLTEGSGSRVLTLLLVFFGMVGLAVWYDVAAFKNLSTIEGMDQAQLARQISRGHGFTTQFIRPFSVHLLRRHGAPEQVLWEAHPDVANAPLFPVVLAGLLKALPAGTPDTTTEKQFSTYSSDLWIAILNQGLFLLAVWMAFRLARRLLDEPAAWVTAAVLAGSDLFWRFSVSGGSTQLLMVIFLGLAEVLTRLEPQTREGATRSEGWLLGMVALAGGLAALAGLTRYSLGLVILPVLAFLAGLPGAGRPARLTVCVLAFAAVLGPWVARNYLVAGTPFGTAGFALFANTSLFPGFELERTLNPDFSLFEAVELRRKFLTGCREILERDLPRLGGSWVSAFFLTGLLVPFRSPTLSRLRSFLVVTLLVLSFGQAMGRTGLSTDTPEVNSENLLAVVAPLVFLFGVGLFFQLVNQFGIREPSYRMVTTGLFLGVASAPLLFTLFSPVRSAVAYPPYYPPYIQEKAHWVAPGEVIMSDFPWAVAWYGERPSVWLSLKFREEVSPKYRNDFFVMNQPGQPIHALYLSARTLKTIETQALSGWLRSPDPEHWEASVSDWDAFILLGVYLKHEIPSGFPLKRAPFGLLPELFLGDSERKEGKPIKGE